MKKIVLACMLIAGLGTLNAQQNLGSAYKTALGVKVYPGAISIKHFISQNAVEGLGYVTADGFRLTGLYELHYSLGNIEGLKWYIGGGAHLGIWSDAWKNKYPERTAGLALGVDGIWGVDYKIKGAPLNISFDWQPSFNLIGYHYFEGGWGGLGIRYTF
ncbi:MAG: hypothetical protein RLZZ28_2447 [Bacteroidota bacterium]|jgi:hypothetical protein